MRLQRRELLLGGAALGATALGTSVAAAPDAERPSPAAWPAEQRARLLAAESILGAKPVEVTGEQGLVVSSFHPFAVHAGLTALKAGGSAADAALATAFSQCALQLGMGYSFAGLLAAVCYDAGGGRLLALDAGFNTVRAETDPATIPGGVATSGRRALTPGFMAGAQALHDRFGKLAFAELLQPAIWLAETGFAFGQRAIEAVENRAQVVRSPDALAIFARPDGSLHSADDIARQPELAHTLRQVARHGADYMYRGPWASRLVDAVQKRGGRMTAADLAAYAPNWGEPARISYGPFDVAGMPAPCVGGLATLGALKIVEAADIRRLGHYAQSPEALFALIKASRWSLGWAGMAPDQRRRLLPTAPDTSDVAILADGFAAWAWDHIRHAAPPAAAPAPAHTAAVLAADRWGNVVSLVHSSNGDWFGAGMVVGGVFIPEPAAFQQAAIARAGPGVRLPDLTNPTIALRGGKPFLASGAIGQGLHVASLQNLVNVLDFGMTPQQSGDQPKAQGPSYATDVTREAVALGDFSPDVLTGLAALGQPVELGPRGWQQATWVGLGVGAAPRYRSGVDRTSPGPADGY